VIIHAATVLRPSAAETSTDELIYQEKDVL
jgi:hypothetical protein